MISLAIVTFGIYSTKGTDYDSIYKSTFGRFKKIEITNSKSITVKDYRSELTAVAKSYFEGNPVMGIGATRWTELPYMADNPYETLAKDGIFGTLYLYFPLLLLLSLGLKYKDVDLIKVLFVIFLGFLHRPFHGNLLTYFIVYSMLYMYIKNHQLQIRSYGKV